MNEFNALGDERYSPVGIASAGSILQIPLDGIAHLRELHADLMLAPGDKIHLDDAVAVACGNGSVAQLSPLGVGVRGFAGDLFMRPSERIWHTSVPSGCSGFPSTIAQ